MDEDNPTSVPDSQTPKPPIENPETPTVTNPEQPQPVSPAPPKKDFKPSKPKGGKKSIKILLIIIALAFAAVVAWWFFIKKDASNTANAPTPSSSQTSQLASYTPENVAYAFKAKDSDPYIAFIRPATGGERVAAKTLIASEPIMDSDVYGTNVVFVTSKSIYVSTDSGKTYTAVFDLAAGEQVTSVKFSTDGKTIAYGSLPDKPRKNIVKTMDLTGKNTKDLFTSTQAGVFIHAYSSSKNKIAYQEGCYGCDGGPGSPVIRDLTTNKVAEPFKDVNVSSNIIQEVAVNSEFSSLIYLKSTANTAGDQAVSAFFGAPYTINTINLSDNKSLEVTSIGTKGEKASNGTLKTREVHVGFVAGTNTAYYSADKQLFTVKSGKPSLTFESTNNILLLPFVGTEEVIVGIGKDTSDYTLSNYNFASKKSIKIFQGDNNTVIFGVTTK